MSSERDATIAARAILLLGIGTLFMGIFDHSAWAPDEPREAAISLEMSRSGSFLVPHFMGQPFVEKPPLYYVTTSALIRLVAPLVGVVGAVRLASALYGLGTLGLLYLLARRLGGKAIGFVAVLVMVSLTSFVQQARWIRTDIAVLCCVTGAVWGFAEAYLGGRMRLLPVGGVFTGLAFLVKGPIGVAIIATAWFGLVTPWLLERWRERGQRPLGEGRQDLSPGAHLLAGLALAAIIALWVVPFYLKASPELWKAWFWDNQFGRFSGTAEGLGHTGDGKLRPFYYLSVLLSYSVPWTPLVFVWLWQLLVRLRSRRLSREDWLLASWGLGSLLLLTLSSTKRSVYFLPVLPAFALMISSVLERSLPRWLERLYAAVAPALALVPLVLLLAAALGRWIPDFPEGRGWKCFMPAELSAWHLVTLGSLLASLALGLKARSWPLAVRGAGLVATAHLSVFSVVSLALEPQKGTEEPTRGLLERIPEGERSRVASFRLTETERGCLYLYSSELFEPVGCDRLSLILEGADPDFGSVIVGRTKRFDECAKVPYKVLAEAAYDESDAEDWRVPLRWVKGDREAAPGVPEPK